ncbi:MAG: sulfotransferase [Phycisphaerales bacterium]
MSANEPNTARARALVARGRELERQRDYGGAEQAFRRAIGEDAAHAPAFAALARVLERTNNLEGASAAADRAVELDPADDHARLTRANLLRRAGDPAGARAEFERVLLKEAPGSVGEAVLAVAWNRYGLTLDALSDAERAMAAFERANDIRWSMPDAANIDAAAPVRRLDATRAFLTADRMSAWAATDGRADAEPADPVFLAGFPRSGTTLTERILGAHPAAAILDERSPMRETILRARELAGGTPYPDVFDQITPAQARELRAHYWSGVAHRAGEGIQGRRLIDKVPLHLLDLAAIVRLFPRARVLMAIRDPRDVCVSAAMQLMVPNPAMASLRTVEGAARFYARVMGLWVGVRDRLPNPVLESRYEDLVADPDAAARRLVAFVGLEWDDAVLEFHRGARRAFIATPSFEAVAKPISGDAQGRWTRYARWVEPALPELQPFLDAWGYGG